MIIVVQTLHHITFNVKLGFRCLENIFEDIALIFLKTSAIRISACFRFCTFYKDTAFAAAFFRIMNTR
jgi:hypothetical protein